MLQYAYQRFFLLHFGWIWINTFYNENLCHENGIIQILADTFIIFDIYKKKKNEENMFFTIIGCWRSFLEVEVCVFSNVCMFIQPILYVLRLSHIYDNKCYCFVAYNNKFPIICLDYTHSSMAQFCNLNMFPSN